MAGGELARGFDVFSVPTKELPKAVVLLPPSSSLEILHPYLLLKFPTPYEKKKRPLTHILTHIFWLNELYTGDRLD